MYVNKMTGEQVDNPEIKVVWLDDVENVICTSCQSDSSREEFETDPDDQDNF